MASITDTTILLNIEHLDRVLSELQHFADAEWESFGLKCGLHYNTLEAIKRDAGSTKESFTKCVALWLKRKDNVDGKGKPTLERLADIVKETGDKATAEEIRIRNGIAIPAKDLEFHQVTQSMPRTPAQSFTSLWSIVILVSVLVATSPRLRNYDRTLTRHKDPKINKYPAAGPTAPAVPFMPQKLIRSKSHHKKADADFLSADKEILENDNFEKMDIGNILRPLTNEQLRFVLIEGEPGIGKSTLAKELTLRWVKQTDAFLTDYRIVILIPLCLETYQKAKTIANLLIDVDDINMNEVMLAINETKGAGVIWILDGFDELPHHLRNSSTSIFIKLIKGDILPKSTVIVTSRHAATEPLLTFLEDDSKHIALRGFGTNEILEYASKYFKNDTIVSEFHSYYSGNTVIENMLYNPMNCFIMCKVFTDFIYTKNNNNKHPRTMTGIYNYYVRALLQRHLIDTKVINIDYEMPPHLIQIIDFKHSVLSGIWKDFYNLSKIAFNGVMKQEYIFGKELHGIPKLSMMDTIVSFSAFDKDESSSFIHTSLQDYFAAIYLVNNPQFMFAEEELEQNSNLENVLIFYVGLSKYIDKEIGTLDFNAQMSI
uniref:NACHT domain-containing protein n=1 Tax=Amphimedon queenslandica TaxID=400682 RepID=A0A1X7THM4_AMPQE